MLHKIYLFYEIVLNKYILPPNTNDDNTVVNAVNVDLKKKSVEKEEKDIFSFKVFDINAKCKFKNSCATNLINDFTNLDFKKDGKIVAIKSKKELGLFSADLEQVYQDNGYNVLRVSSTEMMAYKPWGAFETLFRDYFKLSCHNDLIDIKTINPTILKKFQALFDFIQGKTIKALTPEDARFAYMEQWCNFLSILKNTVIVFESFENLDDTTIQTLELYFDKFKNVVPNFLFVTTKELSVHTKIKTLLRTVGVSETPKEEGGLIFLSAQLQAVLYLSVIATEESLISGPGGAQHRQQRCTTQPLLMLCS